MNRMSPRAANLFDVALSIKQPLYNAGKVRTAVRLATVEAAFGLIERQLD